jgi:hypothetical protein
VQQHVPDNSVRPLAVLLPRKVSISSVISARLFSLMLTSTRDSFSSIISSAEIPEKLLTKIERVLDLVCDASGELTKRGQLLRLHEAVLRGLQILQRGGQFACAGFYAFEQAYVLDCNSGSATPLLLLRLADTGRATRM